MAAPEAAAAAETSRRDEGAIAVPGGAERRRRSRSASRSRAPTLHQVVEEPYGRAEDEEDRDAEDAEASAAFAAHGYGAGGAYAYGSEDEEAGGGILGLAVRVNILGEGLEKTQEFLGGAAQEANEILEAAFERIGILHSRVSRLEAACGLATPPDTPRSGEGRQAPGNFGAEDMEDSEEARYYRQAAQADEEGDCGRWSAGLNCEPPGSGRREAGEAREDFRAAAARAAEAEAEAEAEVAALRAAQTKVLSRDEPCEPCGDSDGGAVPSRPKSPATISPPTPSTECETAKGGSRSGSRTMNSTVSTVALDEEQLAEGLRARLQALEMQVAAMGAHTPSEEAAAAAPGLKDLDRELAQWARNLSDPARLEEPPSGEPLPGLRAEIGRALAEAEARLREEVDRAMALATEEMRGACQGEAGQIGDALRSEVEARMEHLAQQSAALRENLRAELCAELSAERFSESLRSELGALESAQKELRAELGSVTTELRAGIDSHRAAASAAADATEQRLAMLEGELSRGRVRASRPSIPSSPSGRSSEHSLAADATATSGGAVASQGLAHGLSTLARLLGLLREGEALSPEDWAEAADGGGAARRLEQAWRWKSSEFESPSASTAGRSADLFELLRLTTSRAASAAAAAGGASGDAGTAALPDRREAARLKAWLASTQWRAAQAGAAHASQGSTPALSRSSSLPGAREGERVVGAAAADASIGRAAAAAGGGAAAPAPAAPSPRHARSSSAGRKSPKACRPPRAAERGVPGARGADWMPPRPPPGVVA
eukprot:TRINITY_DN6859_c0_g1_i1.p1 TRINITY_DN6859_c0_g1~~TRINITY_DN6859_c0_g1_i1.p1  ORF type:complete len:826 (+),score=237.59 TRINITY_DN6859_c0_g1_i1:137-2479(+)